MLANVKRMAPEAEKVDDLVATLMKPHCQLMGLKDGYGFLPAKDYSLEGLNIKGKVKLDRLVTAARNYLDADFGAADADKLRMNILFFDEVDGLLQDRAGASRSWEITQVNEFLQQMENFDGVMVSNADRIAALKEACALKKDGDHAATIGF